MRYTHYLQDNTRCSRALTGTLSAKLYTVCMYGCRVAYPAYLHVRTADRLPPFVAVRTCRYWVYDLEARAFATSLEHPAAPGRQVPLDEVRGDWGLWGRAWRGWGLCTWQG